MHGEEMQGNDDKASVGMGSGLWAHQLFAAAKNWQRTQSGWPLKAADIPKKG